MCVWKYNVHPSTCTAQAATNMWRFCGQGDERRDGHAYDGVLYWASGGDADQVEGAVGGGVGSDTGGGANGAANSAAGDAAVDAAGKSAGGAAGGAAAGRVTARVLEISEIDEAYGEMRSFAAALATAAPALNTPIGLRVSPPVPTSGADAPADGVPRWRRSMVRRPWQSPGSAPVPLEEAAGGSRRLSPLSGRGWVSGRPATAAAF